MKNIVFLSGESIYLRPIEPGDLNENYLQWLNDEEVCQFNSHAIFPYNLEGMRDYLAFLHKNSTNNVVLAIIDKKTDKHIGNASLQNINWINRDAEFAILLGEKEYWGKKIGREVAALILDYGFTRLNLHRIYCGTSSLNIGMQKIATSLNMQQEGLRRQAMFKCGKYVDILEFGVLKSEFYANS